jgi:hypothetical protein
MAEPYSEHIVTPPPKAFDVATSYVIRNISLSDLRDALRLGWEDFNAVPSHAVILCVIYPVLGIVLFRMVLGYSVLPLLFPLAAGFALLGPFAALGLYELSRRRERGEEASASDALGVLRAPSCDRRNPNVAAGRDQESIRDGRVGADRCSVAGDRFATVLRRSRCRSAGARSCHLASLSEGGGARPESSTRTTPSAERTPLRCRLPGQSLPVEPRE